jgi:hypothetical protein
MLRILIPITFFALFSFGCSGKSSKPSSATDDSSSSGELSSSEIPSSSSSTPVTPGHLEAELSDLLSPFEFSGLHASYSTRLHLSSNQVYYKMFRDGSLVHIREFGSWSFADGTLNLKQSYCAGDDINYCGKDSIFHFTTFEEKLWVSASGLSEREVSPSTFNEPPNLIGKPTLAELTGIWTQNEETASLSVWADSTYSMVSGTGDSTTLRVGKIALLDNWLITVPLNSNQGLAYKPQLLRDTLNLTNPINEASTWALSDAILPEPINPTELTGTFSFMDATQYWSLEFNGNGTFSLNVQRILGAVSLYSDTGTFTTAGNILILDFNDGYSNRCTGDGEQFTQCFSRISGEATLSGSLAFSNDEIPVTWAVE